MAHLRESERERECPRRLPRDVCTVMTIVFYRANPLGVPLRNPTYVLYGREGALYMFPHYVSYRLYNNLEGKIKKT